MRRRVGRRMGAAVALTASGGLVLGLLAVGPTSAGAAEGEAAPLQPILPAKANEKLPDPWADRGGESVAFSGGRRSVIHGNSGGIQVIVRNTGTGVHTTPKAEAGDVARDQLEGRWANLNGKVKGVVTGRTDQGKPVSIPVRFTSDLEVTDKRITVSAVPLESAFNSQLNDAFPQLTKVGNRAIAAGMNYVGVVGTDGDARTWRFSEATRSGKLTLTGNNRYRVALNKASDDGEGVQMGHNAAGLPWSYLQKEWNDLSGRGVKPQLIVQGIGRGNSSETFVIMPESLAKGRKLVFRGDAQTRLTKPERRRLRTLRGVSATLVTSNAGHDTNYIVITGDSISSGESGRYLADYESANWQSLLGWIDFEKFCARADLACTEATQSGTPGLAEGTGDPNNKPAKVTYNTDLTRVYEKGTEKTGECHRSKAAPGTWLARYYALEQKQDVKAINLACSGATTKAITRPYNGQRPQAEELSELSSFLHVPFVTNTMGANDIGFSSVAISCYLNVAKPFLGALAPAGEAKAAMDLGDLLESVGEIIDAPWNPWFGIEKVKDKDEFRKVNPYCWNDPEVGGLAEKKIKELPDDYRAAMSEVLDAAPSARVIAANYPNLIPHNSQSNLPREQALKFDYDRSKADRDDPAPEDAIIPRLIVGAGWSGGIPDKPNFETMTFEQLRENRKQWADGISGGLGSTIAAAGFIYPLISTANLLFSDDMNWAAWKMIPSLDQAVYSTASSMGDRVIPVDTRELFNGREYTTRYKGGPGTEENPDFPDDKTLSSQPHLGYVTENWAGITGPGYRPDQLRASFVTAPLAGVPFDVPVLCPSGDFAYNGSTASNGSCRVGAMNEPLHPNWRGQAAEGQCYVAVVTGMAGDGNACVRSIGANEATVPDYGPIWTYLRKVEPDDMLCVRPDPRTDYDLSVKTPVNHYRECTSTLHADPKWDPIWQSTLAGREWK